MTVPNFDTILKELGYDRLKAAATPNRHIVYGYKNGEKIFTGTSVEAATAAGAVATEKVENPEYRVHCSAVANIHAAAVDKWRALLFAEQSGLPERILTLAYDRAYDTAHAYGYDSVAERFDSECDYARCVIKAISS